MAIFSFWFFEFSVIKLINTPINTVKSAIPTPGCIAQPLPLPSRPSCSFFAPPYPKIEHPNVTSNERHGIGHGLCYWPAAKNCCTNIIIIIINYYFWKMPTHGENRLGRWHVPKTETGSPKALGLGLRQLQRQTFQSFPASRVLGLIHVDKIHRWVHAFL